MEIKKEQTKEIISVSLVNQCGMGNKHEVGVNGVTSIEISYRQISDNSIINIILVKNEDKIIEEISMNTPYVLSFKTDENE